MTQAASVKKWFQPVSFPLWYRRLLSSLRELWRAESQVDVGFICADGSVVKAHAVMLANASKMMKSLLSSQIVTDVTESHDAVYYISLPDFSPDAVRVLMESLYLGSVPTNDNHHSEFRELCILFGIACQDEESMTDEEVEFEREPNSATTVASFDEDIQVLQTDDGELLLLSSRVDKNVITEKTNAEVGVATNAKEKVERPGGIEINQNKLCKLCHKKALEHRVFVVDNLQTTREPFFMYRCCMPSCKDKALKTSRAFHSHVEADHTSPQQDFLSAPDPQRTCPLCKKPRLQHKNRDLSGKANHDKKGSRYKCCHCSAARLSAAKFFAHVENHVEKKFKCVKCDKGFSYQHLLDAHKHKVHEQDGSGPKELFRCDQADCDYVTSYKQSLMGHKNERHLGLKRSHRQADMGQTVICLKCGKSLKKWYYQQYHKRSCMAGTSLYQCDICKQDGFVNKTTLKNHMRSKHSDERPYQCEYCPSKYATAMSLSCHRSRKHNVNKAGEFVPKKMFPCGVCGKLLTNRTKLAQHVKVIHEDQKDFACAFCHQRFASKSNLKIHEGTKHTGILPYKCTICEVAFSRKTSLALHSKQAHANDPREVAQETSSVQQHFNAEPGTNPEVGSHNAGAPSPHEGSKVDERFSSSLKKNDNSENVIN